MRRTLKWIWRIFAGLATLLVIALIAAYFVMRSSLPEYDGTETVGGLNGPVTVVRDANGVPHIHAENDADAYFALGYVHAQDRLFQMEMMRRLGSGRLSEAVGEAGLRTDRFIRTLGFRQLAEAALERMPPRGRETLTAYAAGVNAYLENRDGLLPPELLLLGVDPEPWTPTDSLVWGRLMALTLSTNWANELLRMRMVELVGEWRIRALWPDYPADGPTTLSEWRAAREDLDLDRLLAELPLHLISQGASNEWVVHGRLTESGAPILANDPHLSMRAPILWYLARIKTPTLDVTGVTVPGVPLHVLGHNGQIAWGFTTTYVDTDDLFIERVDPDDPAKYLTPNGSEPFEAREEVIRVARGEDVTITVRATRHGPVISDVLGPDRRPDLPEGHVLALSAPWLREEDETPVALYYMNRAHDWESFVDALRHFHAPLQNIVYADVDGNIGFYSPGLVPIRRRGDGTRPAPGWTGDYDWTGFIPFDELPHALNPENGRFVNSNNRIVGRGYPYHLTFEWGDHYRAARVTDLLEGQGVGFTLDDMAEIQGDHISYMARDLLPLMLEADPADERSARALDMLREWDGAMDRRRPEPLIFTAWLAELNRALYGDELAPMIDRYWSLRPNVVRNILRNHPDWCDDIRTRNEEETCAQQLRATLETVVARLVREHGERMGDWRWGSVHYADLRHQVFNYIPLVRRLANLRIPADGGTYTVNKAQMNIRDERNRFAARHGPGYRALFDLSDLSQSRFVITTGQSEHPLSPYYDNMLERWRDIRFFTIAQDEARARAGTAGVLRLVPSGGN